MAQIRAAAVEASANTPAVYGNLGQLAAPDPDRAGMRHVLTIVECEAVNVFLTMWRRG